MLDSRLMKYIPREYKKLVVDIYEGEKEWDEIRHLWLVPVTVEWENFTITKFANKEHMRACLKEFHAPDEYREYRG